MAKYIECDFLASTLENHFRNKPNKWFHLDNVLYMLKICPTADVVSREVFEQVKWERDTALKTLEEHGIGLGQKADVVEVKHGRWIEREESLSQKSETIAQCSVCGEGWLVESAFPFESCVSRLKHCPNCGAKMDLKEGAEE